MKKLLFVLLAMVLFSTLTFAAQKNLNFFWSQTLPSPNDLAGWGVYQASVAGGPYTKIADIAYVSQQTEYTTSQTITVVDGQITTLYFVVDAVDTSGNRSAKSNEIAVPIDFQAPDIPVQLRIVIISAP